MRINHWRLAALLAAFWLWPGGSASAAPGPRFHVDVWTAEVGGLPENSVVTMIQTRDGYLWLGTLNGLVRFDGVQFKVFDEHNTPGLPSGRIVFLFEDSQTNLWIGTETAGALLLKDGRITNLGFGRGSREGRVRSACEDSTGAVWLRNDEGALARFQNGKLDAQWNIGQGHALIAEKSGMVWVGTSDGLIEIDPATVRGSTPLPRPQMPAAKVDFLLASRTGGRWCLGRDGAENMLEKWVGDTLELNLGTAPWPIDTDINAACEDEHGNLIVGTRGYGLWWFDVATRKATRISKNDGLTGNTVLSLLMDNTGSLWVGLEAGGPDRGGLNRLNLQLLHPLDASAGLTVQSVCEDDQGRLWFSSASDGIDFWKDGVLKNAGSRPAPMKGFDVRALLADHNHDIWAATFSAGLFRWKDGLFQPAEGINQRRIAALHEDRAGRLWAGAQGGLAGWDGHTWKLYTTHEGLSAQIVRAIADDTMGNLWIGTEGGGLNCLKDGKFTAFQQANGFPSDNISALYVDKDDVVWVGTFGNGLIRFQSGSWTTYTTDNGLNGNGIDYLIEDDQGFLWIGSNAGLMRVKKSALNDYAARKLDFVPCHSYAEREGLPPGSECTLGSQPAACRARDGTLWFPTSAGLVSVDPSQIPVQTNAVPVIIESVLIDGEQQNTNGPHGAATRTVMIPAGKETLDIQYTALNFTEPQQTRFKYQMTPHESRWFDAGRRRTAHYTKLPPGTYRFQVVACNDDGVWNAEGASLDVTVLPAFWQTPSFRVAVTLAILGVIIALVYFISTEKLQRQLGGLRQQQALEKDRARIARDIHDQVGASLTQLSLLGEMVESDKDSPEEVAGHAAQITQTARETAHALDEIVWTVNPSNDTLEGLINYICKHAQEYLAVAGLRYRLEAPAQLPAVEISPEARHNVFLAAKESVTNIVKHAKASEACIRLRLSTGSFTLEIEDNGRGPAGLTGPAAQSRNGMRNMRKRMEDVGGKFEIGPGAHGGTLVRLTAPMIQIEVK